MDFIVTGVVTQVLQPQSGQSQKTGNLWMSQEFLIEHESGQYPKSLCFRVFGQERIQQFNIQQGEYLTVHLNIESRPARNGGYFTDISAWKVERQAQQQYAPQGYQPMAPQQGYQQAPMPQYQQPVQQAPFPPQQPPMAQGGQLPFPPAQ